MEQTCEVCSHGYRADYFDQGMWLCGFCALLVYEATLSDEERVSSDRGATECKSSVPVADVRSPRQSG